MPKRVKKIENRKARADRKRSCLRGKRDPKHSSTRSGAVGVLYVAYRIECQYRLEPNAGLAEPRLTQAPRGVMAPSASIRRLAS
jgi:hypothetical protein